MTPARKFMIGGLLAVGVGFGVPACSHAGDLPFAPGEKMVYAIKKTGFTAGEATLEFKGVQDIDGRRVLLIVFTAKAPKLWDVENIYVDAETFYPVRVDREVDFIGPKEHISEHYDMAGKVRITKTVGDKTTEQTIEKEEVLDNLYGFIFRYRAQGDFALGEKFTMNLPTMDVVIKMVSRQAVKAAGKTYNAFFMQSEPKKYRVWFADGEGKVPLRIDGAVGFGNTSMVLREYTPGASSGAEATEAGLGG